MKRIQSSSPQTSALKPGWGTKRALPLVAASFDPALPLDHSEIVAEVLRDQFNGLKSIMDGISSVDAAEVDGVNTLSPWEPAAVSVGVVGQVLHFSFGIPQGWQGEAGPTGADGPVGPPFAQAVVDGVTTLAPGDLAWVDVNFDGTYVRFSFGIPQGVTGSQGEQGGQGQQGDPGPQGPPFATVVVDGVNTLSPGSAATVDAWFDGTNVHLTFGIPQGETGAPGEVTWNDLNTAMAGTSNNSNDVEAIPFTAAESYDQAQFQGVISKINELILALRRT